MPLEVKAYACVYRCGYRYLSKRKAMEEHEERCLHNPAVRACVTCKHDGQDVRLEPRYCDIDARWGASCIRDCPEWCSKPRVDC